MKTGIHKAYSINSAWAFTVVAAAGSTLMAAERDIQFINIFPETRVLMLFNSGTESVALDGWRFCSHNTTQVRHYTNPSAFNGVTIAPSTSFTIHLNNDADPMDSNQFNASDVGLFATFQLDAFAISFYFPNAMGNTPFSNGNFIADHLQWSLGGVDNLVADERSDEAEAGGVWTDQSAWISVRQDTVLIELTDPTFAELHGPENYNVINNCPADLTDDGQLNFFDVSAFLTAFASMDPAADFSGDGQFNFFDVSSFLSLFAAGCP